MLEARARLQSARASTSRKHAVAVTGEGSELDQLREEGRLAAHASRCGTGSAGAPGAVARSACCRRRCRASTSTACSPARATWTRSRASATRRRTRPRCWRSCGITRATGAGQKDMVVLPYKDRLLLFSRYLQQLVMESLGKELDLDGKAVNQGIAVYGNKGSTDQHAYVQQLRDGVNNFFVTFIEVLQGPRGRRRMRGRAGRHQRATTCSGFLLGTRRALYEKGRESITLTVPDVSAAHAWARSSRSTSARWASTRRWSTSTPTTSPASRRARRPPRRCSRCRRSCSPSCAGARRRAPRSSWRRPWAHRTRWRRCSRCSSTWPPTRTTVCAAHAGASRFEARFQAA